MTSERKNNIIALTSAIIISLAALLNAWCGFQSSQWGNLQSNKQAEANRLNSSAMEEILTANEYYMTDAMVNINFMNFYIADNQKGMDFYLARVRPELSAILQKWRDSNPLENPDAYKHPLAGPEYLKIAEKRYAPGKDLRKQSAEARAIAANADKVSSNYLLLSMLFSVIMFLSGIESKLEIIQIRIMLLSFAGVLFLFSIYRLVLLPVAGN